MCECITFTTFFRKIVRSSAQCELNLSGVHFLWLYLWPSHRKVAIDRQIHFYHRYPVAAVCCSFRLHAVLASVGLGSYRQ
ncbi:MAG: hypothetical protein D6691_00065 [Candidatus Hydrogenedentota bacterium]|nr:MAG: hypothetical protein D6691_00065 [Candidatus Hydrogenedentota bacterium]